MKKLVLLLLFPFLTYGQIQIGQNINGEASGDQSGRSISLSADGTIVAIGAEGNTNENGNLSGHVRVYENIGGTWTQIGQDINGQAIGNLSGSSVSLSSDGSIVAVGARGNDSNGENAGHVRVYENQEGTWVQIGQDIDGENSEDFSGRSVSLSSDGSIVAIGADGNDGNGNFSGHVRVYENQEGTWIQIGQDIDGEALENRLGSVNNVSLSADGTIVATGATINDGNGTDSGHVRLFENIEGVWTQIGQDIDGENPNDQSGNLSLSADGTIVAIGARGNSENGDSSGHVRVYENLGGTWTQIGQDIDGQTTEEFLGAGVSLSANGNIVGISVTANDENALEFDHALIYQNQNGNWVQIGQAINSGASNFVFGIDISLSSNGDTVALGSFLSDGNGASSGQVRVFDLSDLLSTEEFTSSTFSLYPNPATTQVTIEIPQESTLEKITIYNSLGQQILTSRNTTINTATLSQGIYSVEVKTNQGSSSKKLIIQ